MLLLGVTWATVVDTNSTLTRIAFGSCFGQFGVRNERVWESIHNYHPDLFIWSGDVAYTDVFFPFFSRYATPEEWKSRLLETKTDPGYRDLQSKSMIIGTWDDHDSGLDDGDRTNPHLSLAKSLFLDFIDEPASSDRYRHSGIYTSYLFGTGNHTVKVILLDVRTFRDPWTYTELNYDGDTLGEEQWKWLEGELRSPGTVNLIVSGRV